MKHCAVSILAPFAIVAISAPSQTAQAAGQNPTVETPRPTLDPRLRSPQTEEERKLSERYKESFRTFANITVAALSECDSATLAKEKESLKGQLREAQRIAEQLHEVGELGHVDPKIADSLVEEIAWYSNHVASWTACDSRNSKPTETVQRPAEPRTDSEKLVWDRWPAEPSSPGANANTPSATGVSPSGPHVSEGSGAGLGPDPDHWRWQTREAKPAVQPSPKENGPGLGLDPDHWRWQRREAKPAVQPSPKENGPGLAPDPDHWRWQTREAKPTPQPLPSSQSSLPIDRWSAQILAMHNDARNFVGASPLKWNPQLATDAAAYAQQLARSHQLVHAPREGRGIERENLLSTPTGMSPNQMMNLWIGERRYFHPGIFPNVCDGDWSQCAHYSQMIWPTTTDVGCGMAPGGGFDWLVCRYSPGGNKDGKLVGQQCPPRDREMWSAGDTMVSCTAEAYFGGRAHATLTIPATPPAQRPPSPPPRRPKN